MFEVLARADIDAGAGGPVGAFDGELGLPIVGGRPARAALVAGDILRAAGLDHRGPDDHGALPGALGAGDARGLRLDRRRRVRHRGLELARDVA